jgi:peptide/nickel transport system ATP-binding protein
MLIKAYPDPFAPYPPPFEEIIGEVSNPLSKEQGCPFHTRCPIKEDKCLSESPELKEVGENHRIACFLTDKLNRLN